jgi:hypothetical protein
MVETIFSYSQKIYEKIFTLQVAELVFTDSKKKKALCHCPFDFSDSLLGALGGICFGVYGYW